MESLLYTNLLRYNTKKRVFSSDKEDGRQDKVTTPSECVARPICTSSSPTSHGRSPAATKGDTYPECSETVIRMVNSDEAAWNTEEERSDGSQDDTVSETSTPDYRRGHHSVNPALVCTNNPLVDLEELQLEKQAVQELNQETTPQCEVKRPPSVHILVDAKLINWPVKVDKVCVVDFHPEWTVSKWVSALCAETV